jgi:hypothetical protein
MIDEERLAEMASRDPLVHAQNELGADGAAMVARLVQRVRAVYKVLSPEALTTGMTIIEPLDPGSLAANDSAVQGRQLAALSEIPDHFRVALTLVPLPNGQFRGEAIVREPTELDHADAFYYRDANGRERIWVAGREFVPDNPTDSPSAFGIPTFSTLEETLRRFAIDCARHGAIGELRNAWRSDQRLMFNPSPEATMRRALEAFLIASLREVREIDIRPETPVDESHPVDIRVVFTHTNRTALIEIKWMGDSADAAGNRHVKHRKARAKSGAQQLADYLDSDEPRSTGHQVIGYLVVLDARRRGITPHTATVTAAQGMHYKDDEVEFQPEILARADFAEPMRMFMEPACH